MFIIYPIPGIEIRLIVQVIDVHRKVKKTVITSLVIRLFMDFLGASITCASIVFSISGLEYLYSLLNHYKRISTKASARMSLIHFSTSSLIFLE